MAQRDKQRTGLILYFDLIPALERMTAEQQGQMLMAALCYAKDGKIPDFENEKQSIVWDLYKPRIDADGEKWNAKLLQTKYAGYSSSEKRQGREPMDFDSWQDWRERRDMALGLTDVDER